MMCIKVYQILQPKIQSGFSSSTFCEEALATTVFLRAMLTGLNATRAGICTSDAVADREVRMAAIVL